MVGRELAGCARTWLWKSGPPTSPPKKMERFTDSPKVYKGTARFCIRPYGHEGKHRGPRLAFFSYPERLGSKDRPWRVQEEAGVDFA
jgi:hypothetical protein